MVLAAAPDVVHFLPVGWWALAGEGTVAALKAYAVALPGEEPLMPPLVEALAHHLHCTMHSALVVGAVTLLVWLVTRSWWLPLLGWWLHVVLDVFTHSADFFPSPVLYPLTYRGFDGLAWNVPWFLALNYAALGLTWWWLLRGRRAAPAVPLRERP